MLETTFEESISLEEYQEIQTWFFMKKKKMDYYLLGISLCGIAIMLYTMLVRHVYYGTQWIIILLPIIYRPITLRKIKKLAKQSYENDTTEWKIEIKNHDIKATPKGDTVYTMIKYSDIFMVYELKSVMLIYFNKDFFVTVAKKDIKEEDYMKLREELYDLLGERRVHLKKMLYKEKRV